MWVSVVMACTRTVTPPVPVADRDGWAARSTAESLNRTLDELNTALEAAVLRKLDLRATPAESVAGDGLLIRLSRDPLADLPEPPATAAEVPPENRARVDRLCQKLERRITTLSGAEATGARILLDRCVRAP